MVSSTIFFLSSVTFFLSQFGGKINQHFQLSSGFFLLVYPLRVFQSTMKQDPVVVSTQSLETFLAYHVLLFSQILVRFELPSGGARFLQISN